MPALATIACHGVPSGLTLTGEVYPDGSDTAPEGGTDLTVAEATNRKTTYILNAGVAGLHKILLKSGSNIVWVGWTPANLAITGSFEACDSRWEALNSAKVAAGSGDQMDLVDSPNETALDALAASVDTVLSAEHGAEAWGGDVDEAALATAIAAELGDNLTVGNFTNAALQQLAGLKVTLKSPTLRGKTFDPPVIRNRDYSATDSNSIDIEVSGWPDFTSAAVALTAVLKDDRGNTLDSINWTGSVVNGGQTIQTLRFQPTAAQANVRAGNYEAEAVVTLSGSGRKLSPAGVFVLPVVGVV